jgi:hypothetical protein
LPSPIACGMATRAMPGAARQRCVTSWLSPCNLAISLHNPVATRRH